MSKMLKKRTYDILTIIFVISLILLIVYNIYSFQKDFQESAMTAGIPSSQIIPNLNLTSLLIQSLTAVYYIFILVLSIQLYRKNRVSLINMIVIVILIPFSFIYYLTYLRGVLREYENGLENPAVTPQVPPSSPQI